MSSESKAHPLSLHNRTPLRDLRSHVDEQVTVAGWVAVARKQKTVQFLVLRDGTEAVQLVHERSASDEIAETIDALTVESVVLVRGTVHADERVKLGGLEIHIHEIEVLSTAEELPIGKMASLDVRLDWRFIDLRSPRNQVIFRVQTLVERTFREYCISKGFLEINSPKLMASPSESRSELFEVKYFQSKAYLAQSPQFYKQMAIAGGFPGVFETGPVFRANPSFTSRHDTEFTSLDVEFPWVTSHEDVMRFEEDMLRTVLDAVQSTYSKEIADIFGVSIVVPSLPFPRITHASAISSVAAGGYTIPRSDGDLDPEAERRLAAIVRETDDHEFVFVTDYPSTVRPFYHMRHAHDGSVTKSFDLLWKGLEITTGAQWEHRPDILRSQIIEKGLDPEGLSFYIDFFRYGCPPHGGFGLGLTRLLMIMLGETNVREVTFLYRGPNRLTP
jgi:nondiscriminating aspartyl-tRNA synthetase